MFVNWKKLDGIALMVVATADQPKHQQNCGEVQQMFAVLCRSQQRAEVVDFAAWHFNIFSVLAFLPVNVQVLCFLFELQGK